MKAAVYTRYGPPEVVQIQDIPRPHPSNREVLVKVCASTVNRTDAGFRSAAYFISRFWTGLFKPRHRVLGCEFAGIVEDTGPEVSTFKKGDRVFGFNDKSDGGHAEYLCMSETEAIASMPEGADFEHAAAVSEGAHYALAAIRAAKVKPGQSVMVYGATGAIGSAALQLLKYFEAEVTAVCNTQNTGLVKSLGADFVVDYQTSDFTKTLKKFDFIFDAVGKSSFWQCRPLLNKHGIYISTELGKNAENIWLALVTPLFGGRKLLFPLPAIGKADILFLKERFEKGEFKPVIDRRYPLEQIVEAYRYVETGQKTGNVIILVAGNCP